MKKIYFIIFINLTCLALQYGLTNHFSTQGLAVAHMESQIDDLAKQNATLTNQISGLASLTTIAQSAQALQLTPLKIDFVTSPGLASRTN